MIRRKGPEKSFESFQIGGEILEDFWIFGRKKMSIFTIEQSKTDFANWMPLILTCNYFNILLYTSKVVQYKSTLIKVVQYKCTGVSYARPTSPMVELAFSSAF